MAKPFHAAPWAYSFPAESARSRPGLAGGHASAPPPPRGAPPVDGRGHGGRSPRSVPAAPERRVGLQKRSRTAARGGRRRTRRSPPIGVDPPRADRGDAERRSEVRNRILRAPAPAESAAGAAGPAARRTARRRTAVPLCPGLRRIVAGVGHRAARGAASESRSNQQIISASVRLSSIQGYYGGAFFWGVYLRRIAARRARAAMAALDGQQRAPDAHGPGSGSQSQPAPPTARHGPVRPCRRGPGRKPARSLRAAPRREPRRPPPGFRGGPATTEDAGRAPPCRRTRSRTFADGGF